MKILVITQYYYPEPFRITDICEELVNKGNEVTVITGIPNYPDGKIYSGYRRFKKRKEIVNGVNIIRSFQIARGKSSIRLFLNYISFMISASIKVMFKKIDCDLIFVYQLSPVTMMLPAVIAKKKYKRKLFTYSCDLWPDSVKNILKNEKSIIYKLTDKYSKYLYRKSDRIGVTSESFITYFIDKHDIAKKKLVYIPQHAEDIYLDIERPTNNGVVDFVFLGNIGKIQDVENIINAVEIIKQMGKFYVHIIGDGSNFESCVNLTREKKLEDRIGFYGRYPLEKTMKFYDVADICLLTLKNESIVGETIPSKLQGYMAAGRPVIAAISGPAKTLIEESKCGTVVKPGDAISLSKVMAEYILNYEKYLYQGENGRNYFLRNFTKKLYVDRLITEFNIMEENENV